MNAAPGTPGRFGLLSARELVIDSPLPPDMAAAALAQQIVPRSWVVTWFPWTISARFMGEISGYEFALSRVIRSRVNMRARVTGRIVPNGSGSQVLARISTAHTLVAWYSLLFTFAIFFMIAQIGEMLAPAICLSALFAVMLLVAARLSHDYELDAAHAFLVEVFSRSSLTPDVPWAGSSLPMGQDAQSPTRQLPQLWLGGTVESQRYGPTRGVWEPDTDHPTQHLPPPP